MIRLPLIEYWDDENNKPVVVSTANPLPVTQTDLQSLQLLWIKIADLESRLEQLENGGTEPEQPEQPGGPEIPGEPPESITLNYTETTLVEPGVVRQLIATVLPETAIQTVEWSSSDASTVKVDQYGLIMGIKPGTATITAKTVNNLTATCVVTVKG